MPVIDYYSTPGGGFQVDVPGVAGSAYPGAGGGGAGMDMSWINAFAKRNAQNKLRQQELDYEQDRESTRPHRSKIVKAQPVNPMLKALEDQTIASKIAELQAQRQPPPLRTSYGPGYIAPNQLDIPKMNAFQRQLFLPQGNSFTGPSLSDQDAAFREGGLGGGHFVESEGGGPARQIAAMEMGSGRGTEHGMSRPSGREQMIAGIRPIRDMGDDDETDINYNTRGRKPKKSTRVNLGGNSIGQPIRG